MASFVKVTADNSQNDAKRKAREARFKNDSKKLAPAKPKRSFAHPGGKITHNKEAALAAYLKRKKGRLTEDQNLFVREGDFVKYGAIFYEIVKLSEPKLLFGQVEHRFEVQAECIRSRDGLFNAE